MKCRLIVLTYNPGSLWHKWLEAYKSQKIKNLECLVIDSGSTDETVKLANEAGLKVESISNSDFGHGITRDYAYKISKGFDILIFMTQDAILYDEKSLSKLIESFKDKRIGISFGRQVPRINSFPIEAHSRLFNYPSTSRLVSIKDKKKLGFKVTFNSNSFSAYRTEALHQIGGFPNHVSFGEDAYVAGKILMNNWNIFYNAKAKVFHSHNYSLIEEARRYFEIGKFHRENNWLYKNFGKPDKEGINFLISEIKYLFKNKKSLIPYSIINTFSKYFAYKIGNFKFYINKKDHI